MLTTLAFVFPANTINDESYAGEKLHGSLVYCRENYHGFAFDKNENNFLHRSVLVLKIILVEKTFTVCRKSTKTAKFSPT